MVDRAERSSRDDAGVPLSDDEALLAREFAAIAREHDRAREADDHPPALLGWLGSRLPGAGTPRCGTVALVRWVVADGEWLPRVTTMHCEGDVGDWVLEARAGAEGRGERACRWLRLHYSAAYRAHMVAQKAAADEHRMTKAA